VFERVKAPKVVANSMQSNAGRLNVCHFQITHAFNSEVTGLKLELKAALSGLFDTEDH
jgi:hypothetical protein